MSETTRILYRREADWDGAKYVTRPAMTFAQWHSADGNEWTYPSGEPVRGKPFWHTAIHLHGGPAAGEVVS